MEYDNDITLVTMFFDINRDNWELSNSVRKTNTYLNAFYHFLDYPYNMVCFIDNRYYNEVIEKYNESKYKNKVFISIDKQWLTEHTLAWKQVGVDEIIMKSIHYKLFMKKRVEVSYEISNKPIPPDVNIEDYLFPENKYPEYVAITHSKIDLLIHALEHNCIKTPYTFWVDFGYFHSVYENKKETFPSNTLDIHKFHKEKLNFIIRNKIKKNNYNPYRELIMAPDLFTGGFWGGKNDLLYKLQDLYHRCVNKLYNLNISDDEQHIYYTCYDENPELFHLEHIVEEPWPKALTYYEKKVIL